MIFVTIHHKKKGGGDRFQAKALSLVHLPT